MIIWIASYPKSGNTWLRALLSSYLYSDDGIFNFNLLKKIDQFPSKKYFKYFLKEFTDIKKVSDYWLAAQERINLYADDIVFFKTHNALCTFENNPFTNSSNTKAIIYVVRDPRNVITSLTHHYSKDIPTCLDFMTDIQQMIIAGEFRPDSITSVLGSWSEHYKSWKNIKFAPILIVKYEDLLKDTKGSLLKILDFLNRFKKITVEDKKIENTISSCSFENLKKKEKVEGFVEAVPSSVDKNKKKTFFNLGKKNNWKNLLEPKIEKKIRETFFKEMKELDYT